jgi:hypothetical protein
MNLGDIYIKSFFCIVGASIAVSMLFAFVWRSKWKTSRCASIAVSLLIGLLLSVPALTLLHHPLFVAWHRAQNAMVPQTGCLTYDPSFARLFAAYRMSRSGFDTWVAAHPWRLTPYANDLLEYDASHLGFSSPDASFASPSGSNGKQLRVYFKNGVMYLSYNSM